MAKLTDKSLAEWLEQVAEGLDAGMEASNAVALAKALPRGLTSALENDFRDGKSWGETLTENEFPFSKAEQSMLEASEISGRLPDTMRRIAESRRELAKLKRRMLIALAYPVFLVHFAALVFSVTYLINGDTKDFLVSIGMVLVPFWLIAGFIFAVARFFPGSVRAVARRIPVFSGYRANWEAGTLCDVLACCFAAGLDAEKSWQIAVQAADSPKMYSLGDHVFAAVSVGSKVSEGLAEGSKLAPTGFIQVYRSGEETGSLVPNLEAAAKRYITDAKSKLVLASFLYPKILLIGVFGYVGYKIVLFVSDYYQQLIDINA